MLVTDEEVSTAIRGIVLATDVLECQVNGMTVRLHGFPLVYLIDENHTHLSFGCAPTEIPEFEKKNSQYGDTFTELSEQYRRSAFQEDCSSKIFHRYSPDVCTVAKRASDY